MFESNLLLACLTLQAKKKKKINERKIAKYSHNQLSPFSSPKYTCVC